MTAMQESDLRPGHPHHRRPIPIKRGRAIVPVVCSLRILSAAPRRRIQPRSPKNTNSRAGTGDEKRLTTEQLGQSLRFTKTSAAGGKYKPSNDKVTAANMETLADEQTGKEVPYPAPLPPHTESGAWLAPVSLIELVFWSRQRGPPHTPVVAGRLTEL